MSNQCVMCGASIAQGIVCEKCDRPRRPSKTPPKAAGPQTPPPEPAPPAPTAPKSTPVTAQKPVPPHQSVSGGGKGRQALTQPMADPFPKAPVVPFPVESTSLAASSVCEVLTAARVASLLVSADGVVRFCSAEARLLLALDPTTDLPKAEEVQKILGYQLSDLRQPSSREITLSAHEVTFSIVPLSGGNVGSVLILRPHDPAAAVQSAFVTYATETIVQPLRTLRDSLAAGGDARGNETLLSESAGTIDQILSSLELAPGVEETARLTPTTTPPVSDVIRRVADRFTSVAARKQVALQLDSQDTDETFKEHHQLEEVIVTLMENSLHYTPKGGQIVLGMRTLEHKGKPLLLFFVMDNGPMVPEEMRQAIFDPGFAWHPTGSERGGRGLSRCRDFAQAHGGSIWVESKTGKACTFFMRVRPDSGR